LSPGRVQLALPLVVEQLSALLRVPALAPWERQAQQPAQWIQEQRELALRERQVVRQAQPELQRAWRLAPHSGLEVSRPQQDPARPPPVPEERRAASAQPSLPLPSQPLPPLPQLPPQPPLPPVLKSSCELSPRRPQGSNSSAFSSP
jgi:hypothetical protein